MEFTNLRKAVISSNEIKKQEWFTLLAKAEGNEYLTHEDVCKRWATPSAIKNYNSGKITIEKLSISARTRVINEYSKTLKNQLEKIDSVESAGDISSINISVEWKKSATWGMNPTATVKCWTDKGFYSAIGSVNSCDYDSLSSAVGTALNQIPAILKPLYIQAEKLKGNDKIYRAEIGYGCGYSVLPYFEGGVGLECFQHIFEKLCYKWNNAGSGKMFDCYTIEKESRK